MAYLTDQSAAAASNTPFSQSDNLFDVIAQSVALADDTPEDQSEDLQYHTPEYQSSVVAGVVQPGPDLTVYDYFADNGATFPWYGDTHEPALYDASRNVTVLSWETNYSNKRYVQVREYDHDTSSYGPIYFAGINSPITDDDHGVPGLYMDHEGYYYVFYGNHGSDQYWAVSTAPGDISAWTEKTPIAGPITYPTAEFFADGTGLLWERGSASGTGDSEQDKYSLYTATGITGGNPSWGSPVTVFELGNLPSFSSRFYNGNHLRLGEDEVVIPFTQADNSNDYSRDIFVAVFNKTTRTVRDIGNTVSVAEASWPIDITTARANYRVVNQTGAGVYGTRVSAGWDTAGNLHIIYGEGPTTDGPFILKHKMWNGSVWSEAVDVGAFATGGNDGHQTDRHTIVTLPNGEIDVYWNTASQFAPDWGGDISRRRRSAAGVWATAEVVAEATASYPLNSVTAVPNGHPDARVIWCESVQRADWAATESNKLKCFAYGDNGYLTRPKPESERGFLPEVYFSDAERILHLDLQAEGRLLNLASTAFQWQCKATGRLFSQTVAEEKPTYLATGWDGTLPAITGDSNGGTDLGDVLESTGPFAATQSVFIVAERGTQNNLTAVSGRSLYMTSLSSGGLRGHISVIRPGGDAGQTIIRVNGGGSGSVPAVSPQPFGIGDKAVIFGQFVDNDLRCGLNSGVESAAGDFGAETGAVTSIFGDSLLTGQQRFGGKIVEILIINRTLTAQEKQYVSAYLAWKWGIQANLDASNPWKTTRPPELAA